MGDLSMKRESSVPRAETPLDLSKPMDLSRSLKDERDHFNNDRYDSRSETGFSENTDYYDDYDQNNESFNSLSPGTQRSQLQTGKRFRTQMTQLQVRMMKAIFNDYMTPTMAECEMLGRDISLPKRVIQVWFQNARAKEKKMRLSLEKQGKTP